VFPPSYGLKMQLFWEIGVIDYAHKCNFYFMLYIT